MDRKDPEYSDDPTMTPSQTRTPGWEPVVGTTYEPQDERPTVQEHDHDHDHDHEHVEGEDTTAYDKDRTAYGGDVTGSDRR